MLIEHKQPRARFARSINVERDTGSGAVDSYLPVGRAIDAITRLAHALDRDDVEVAISITGPYGSGKSSLAVVLDALLGPAKDPARRSAQELLEHTAPEALARLSSALERLQANERGFVRAVVTAQREPITLTVLRALSHGAARYEPAASDKARFGRLNRELRSIAVASAQPGSPMPDVRTVRTLVRSITEFAPVLLLIDEFGKNLEAFSDARGEADLFLLQELAEWTRGPSGLPLAIVTMQHMAFDEYAAGTSSPQRREWAKVQGRFEDIPFIDSAAQTRSLIGSAFEPPTEVLAVAQTEWADQEARELAKLGLTDLGSNKPLLASCWPLHPVSLAALPELCERYGQNERTLFSFLASHEPQSIATFLRTTDWDPGAALPVVRPDRLYDYFIDAATNLVSVSPNASRWVEIDSRIRDAVGLSEGARRVLKTVGLLNLVSAGGVLRASSALVNYATVDGASGTRTSKEVAARLRELEAAGLITFRDFADEYRVWNGSDFDLRTAAELARKRLRETPAADILERVLPLGPIVAARHSHKTGTLRAFDRGWIAHDVDAVQPLGTNDRADGMAFFVLGSPKPPLACLGRRPDEKPTVFVSCESTERLEEAALEVAALDEILAQAVELKDDWVARREVLERRVSAQAELERALHASFASEQATWTSTGPRRRRWSGRTTASGSAVISDSCDAWYPSAPTIRNDLVNRHELSSQAAKARRMLLEVMSSAANEECLGITGFGPDFTLYLSVLQAHGLHRLIGEDRWGFTEPYERSDLRPVWDELNRLLAEASSKRAAVEEIYEALSAPPFGLRAGVAPIVFTAALICASEEVALYEHGTFRPALSDDVLERLLRNPDNFEVKHFASRNGSRAELLTRLADGLGVSAQRRARTGRVSSVLGVVSHLVAMSNTLPDYVKKTRLLSDDTLNIRGELLSATEPDELLFHAIPVALGLPPVSAGSRYSDKDLQSLVDRVLAACEEMVGAFPALLREIEQGLRDHVAPSSAGPLQEGLRARAAELQGKIIDRQVAKLAAALTAEIPDLDGWLTYVAMNVAGAPPEGWSDDDRVRFLVSLRDSGGTFRRLLALNANLDAKTDGFDAYRNVFTRTDGSEVVQVVALDEAIRSVARPLLAEVVAQLAKSLSVSEAEARSILVGVAGEEDLASTHPASDIEPPEREYGGTVRSDVR